MPLPHLFDILTELRLLCDLPHLRDIPYLRDLPYFHDLPFIRHIPAHPLRRYHHVTVFDPDTSSIATYRHSHLPSCTSLPYLILPKNLQQQN
jgi:hypothetical protein